jgi:hypothetical protein
VCGADLNPSPRATSYEPSPSPASAAAPANPHQKRRTVFEPAPGAPAAGSAGPAAPSADFFSNPPPPRPPLNPRDPFLTQPGAAPGAPARKAQTIVNPGPGGTAPGALVRGALFEYRGANDPGRVHPVRAGRNVLGRDASCDIVIDDGRVSGQHAYLFLRAEDASFMDVSTNGSHVDGRVINGEQVTLQHGSVIELGDSRLVLAMIPESLLGRGGR